VRRAARNGRRIRQFLIAATAIVLLSMAGIMAHDAYASPEGSDPEATPPTSQPAALPTPAEVQPPADPPIVDTIAAPDTAPAREGSPAQVPAPAPAPVPTASPITVRELETPFMSLNKQLSAIAVQSGGHVAIALRELGGSNPQSWSYNGGEQFVAASTYKLPALMAEAGGIALGSIDPAAPICYEDGDWEDGWFVDYQAGNCFSRTELAARAGQQSDNTAGHMLVRDLGGAQALNAFAAAHGATSSEFFIRNTTTADDLAALWVAEARGQMGGAPAQHWLYPFLTRTAYEAGVPAGVPAGTLVVHKVGEIDQTANDAALVMGPQGPYVLVVCTDGVGADAGWSLIAQISSRVWQYEVSRQR